MSNVFNRLHSWMARFHVSEPYSNTEKTRARYVRNFVCVEMQRRVHNALESLFLAPAALPIREVISVSMEPSVEMIEPICVNEGTQFAVNVHSSGSCRRRGDHHAMALVLVQLIDIPPFAASLLRMLSTANRSSEEGENSAMSSA